MRLSTLLAFVSALPLPARSADLPDWKKPFTAILLALHESRRREAARHIRRHYHLMDRYRADLQPASQPPDDGTAPH